MFTHLPPQPFASAEEYTDFVRTFVALLDQQFKNMSSVLKISKIPMICID